MKVSIIIPAYNVEKYIERCIESAISQTLKSIEIIVVNDGSKDKTQEIVEKLQFKDKRIKLINKKNGGLSSARNAGIEVSKGEYIQHLDGDDWLEKQACKEMYDISKKNNLDMLILDFFKDYDNGKVEYIKSFEVKDKMLDNYNSLVELNKKNLNVTILAKFIKRNLYIENNIRHPEGISLGEDLATTPKLILLSKNIMKLNKAYYHYIFNPNSITNSSYSKKIGELFIVFKELENFYKENDAIEEYKELLKILKAKHLFNFFYRKFLDQDKEYENNLKFFFRYLKYELDIKTLKKLDFIRREMYRFSKKIKKFKTLKKLIKLISKIKNRGN